MLLTKVIALQTNLLQDREQMMDVLGKKDNEGQLPVAKQLLVFVHFSLMLSFASKMH